jgi:hypothetical protein
MVCKIRTEDEYEKPFYHLVNLQVLATGKQNFLKLCQNYWCTITLLFSVLMTEVSSVKRYLNSSSIQTFEGVCNPVSGSYSF